MNRRCFLKAGAWVAGAAALGEDLLCPAQNVLAPVRPGPGGMSANDLPQGSAPKPVALPHFPDRLHAFVWRNWPLVPLERLAAVVGARPADIARIGKAMGLSGPPKLSHQQQRRSYLTVIRRNWHLVPYDQLLALLGWTPEQMAFTLREDDFLYVKLGNLKPHCEPLRYAPPGPEVLAREREIARLMREQFGGQIGRPADPLFAFVDRLSRRTRVRPQTAAVRPAFSPRFCYSYFALYGDPLLEADCDPYPEGYLAQLSATGVDGVWLQGVLSKLAPFPWEPARSEHSAQRIANLHTLVARARRHGIGVFLYLNEPRALPLSFYESRPGFKGVAEGDFATLCTSVPDVQQYLVDAVAAICRAVPDLAGFFTITASENLTNCWSHGGGKRCPRCGNRLPAAVIAELNGLFYRGIQKAGTSQQLIVWDWGWADAWAPEIIRRLPGEVALMSVSEWSFPIQRGGVSTTVGEYSISVIGPGPRATRHWEMARQRGLKTLAKIQAANTWELSAVPYIPALENVAQHALNLRQTKVVGLMLGWTLGGYPSPNLQAVWEVARATEDAPLPTAQEILEKVARQRFGLLLAPAVVAAWRQFSAAFKEFPFDGGLVYNAPMQFGPGNLLWAEPTGYHSTMIGFPYDDLDGWRGVYPPEVFIAQFEKVADGFDRAIGILKDAIAANRPKLSKNILQAAHEELSVAEAAAIHFRTTANQARFVLARRALAKAKDHSAALPSQDMLEPILRDEMVLARRLYAIQSSDSRIGFEASNQYYYVGVDLAEKVLNAHDLLTRWLPAAVPARIGSGGPRDRP